MRQHAKKMQGTWIGSRPGAAAMDYQVAMVVRVRCECVFLNRLRTAVFVSWHAEEYLAYANLTPNPLSHVTSYFVSLFQD